MSPRATFTLQPDGSFEVYVNEAGRDLLVNELQSLDEHCDHFHLDHYDDSYIADATDIPLRPVPYQAEDRALLSGKVMLRLHKWDVEHYPHVKQTGSKEGR